MKSYTMNTDPQPKVLVAQLGARMHYAVPVLLNKSGMLHKFVTDAYVGEGSSLHRVMQNMPRSCLTGAIARLNGRQADLPAEQVIALNALGLYWLAKFHWKRRMRTLDSSFYVDQSRNFLQKASNFLQGATAIYAFAGTGKELFEAAKERSIYCICEQMGAPIQQYGSIIDQEATRWVGWQEQGLSHWDGTAWPSREYSEWKLADVIICPSQYVADALVTTGVSAEKIVTIPYGVSMQAYHTKPHSYDGTRPLRVLFVGGVSLAKGVPYLLDALLMIGPEKVQAQFVGGLAIARQKLLGYQSVAQFTGLVPRSRVVDYYKWADVFVLPSLTEGSATVTYEARASGLPVIASTNTGAWLEENGDGFTVPIRSAAAIREKLLRFIEEPGLVEQMSLRALERATLFSWEKYEERLARTMQVLHKTGRVDQDMRLSLLDL